MVYGKIKLSGSVINRVKPVFLENKDEEVNSVSEPRSFQKNKGIKLNCF